MSLNRLSPEERMILERLRTDPEISFTEQQLQDMLDVELDKPADKMTSTGLLYKLRKSSKDISIPKPVLMIAGAIIAFVAAFIIKNLFSLIAYLHRYFILYMHIVSGRRKKTPERMAMISESATFISKIVR